MELASCQSGTVKVSIMHDHKLASDHLLGLTGNLLIIFNCRFDNIPTQLHASLTVDVCAAVLCRAQARSVVISDTNFEKAIWEWRWDAVLCSSGW